MTTANRYRRRKTMGTAFEVLVTIAVVAFCLGPLFWVLSTSLKPTCLRISNFIAKRYATSGA